MKNAEKKSAETKSAETKFADTTDAENNNIGEHLDTFCQKFQQHKALVAEKDSVVDSADSQQKFSMNKRKSVAPKKPTRVRQTDF